MAENVNNIDNFFLNDFTSEFSLFLSYIMFFLYSFQYVLHN